RAQDVEGHIGPLAWRRIDAWDPGLAGEVALELEHVLWETLGRHRVAAQGEHSVLVRAGGSPQTEVNAPRMQGLERAELFRNHQRGVVREHDSAGTKADAVGERGDMGDKHAGG